MNNGWHTYYGREVYVENGIVTRAIKKDRNGGYIPAAVYRWDNQLRCWVN